MSTVPEPAVPVPNQPMQATGRFQAAVPPDASRRPMISVVSPVYLGADLVKPLTERLINVLSLIAPDFEIVLVEDGSPDASWNAIMVAGEQDRRVKGIKLSRNFGQHYALSAGLDAAEGDYTICMDCDLQDPPEEIPKLLAKAKEGYDLVYGIAPYRTSKSWFQKLMSKGFYWVYDLLVGARTPSVNASFILLSRTAVLAFREMRETRRQFFTLIQHLGFDAAKVETDHHERAHRQSSYTFMKRVKLAINGITVGSTRLLRAGIWLGFLSSVLSVLYGLYIIVMKLLHPQIPLGWSAIMTSIFFVGGLTMILIGILGTYLEVIFHEVKRRPHYLIARRLNFDASSDSS